MPNRRKRKAPRGERGAFALIKSSKGLGEPHSAGAETALLALRTSAQLDEFRGDALLSVSRKTALYSTAGPPRHGDARAIRPTVDRLTPVERATREQVPPHGCW